METGCFAWSAPVFESSILHIRWKGLCCLWLRLVPDQMLLRQDQELPFLSKHGAARLYLAIVEHRPMARVLAQELAKAS